MPPARSYIDREADLKTIIGEEISIRGGSDSIIAKAARKMQQNEQLITTWAPALLNMQLDNLLWQDRNEVNVGELWKILCTYCYLRVWPPSTRCRPASRTV